MVAEPSNEPGAAGPPLEQLFRPRSIALIGASNRSAWTRTLIENLERGGFLGHIYLVNRRIEAIGDRFSITELSDLPEPPDLAIVLVRAELVLDVIKQAHRAGVRSFVVFAAGFAESGEEGRSRESDLAAYARRHGLNVLGPNNLGYANFGSSVLAFGFPLNPVPRMGGTSIVSQSGALGFNLVEYATPRGLGLDHVISVGNEVVVSVAECIEYLIDTPTTTSICLYLHAIRKPDAFAAACRRAAIAGKPVFAYKAGGGALSARAALAHTGGLVGDDAAVDAVLRQIGVVRAASIEEMMACASLFEAYGEMPHCRAAVVTGAGSAGEIFADKADRLGFELPDFSADTCRRLFDEGLPAFAAAQNPLDVTAGVTIDDPAALPRIERVLLDDPAVDILIILGLSLSMTSLNREQRQSEAERLRQLERSSGKSVLVFSVLTSAPSLDVWELGDGYNRPAVVESIDRGVNALHAVSQWSIRRAELAQADDENYPDPFDDALDTASTWSEHQARNYVAVRGVPLVPAVLARDRADAYLAAEKLGGDVCMKICSAQIQHKTEANGVLLSVGLADVVSSFDTLLHRAELHAPGASVEGVLVSPMRYGGVELIVGVTRHPEWGQILAVGIGGIFVELLNEFSTRRLPVGKAEVKRMLGELRGSSVLDGVRGAGAVDQDAICIAVLGVAHAAWALGDRLEALEINPLFVKGSQVEGLDVMCSFRLEPHQQSL
jgi:acyl-CoA synthetase (NDP forming)